MTTLQRVFKIKTKGSTMVIWMFATIAFWLLSYSFITSPLELRIYAAIYVALTICYVTFHMSRYFKYKKILNGICNSQNDHTFYSLLGINVFTPCVCFDSKNIYLMKQSIFYIIPFGSIVSVEMADGVEGHLPFGVWSSAVLYKVLRMQYRSAKSELLEFEMTLAKSQVQTPNFALLMKRINRNI